MRYATPLHTSRQHHVLKPHGHGGLIALLWFAGTLAALAIVISSTHLDANALFLGFSVSLLRVSAAYGVALVAALILALLLSASRWVEVAFLPVLDALQSFPSFALLPALTIAIERSPEIVIIGVLAIEVIWPILFSVVGALKNRRQDLEDAATVFGARGPRRLWVLTVPTILPALVTGSIVGWGEAWEAIIGAELLVHAQHGIGQYLGQLGTAGEYSLLAFGIVVFMLLLFILNKLLWLPLLEDVTAHQTEA